MAFTVEDYRDLVQLLREHPEWRAELRRELLGDEILRLPELVAENTAAIGRLEASITSLIAAQERTEAKLADLASAQERTEARLADLASAQERTEARLADLASAQERTEARLADLASAQERTEARIETLESTVADFVEATKARFDGIDSRFDEVDSRLGRMDSRFDGIDHRLDRLDTQVGSLRGDSLERRLSERPHTLEQGLRRPRAVRVADIFDLDDLVETGKLTPGEGRSLQDLDLLVTGRIGRGDAATDAYLAVEISGVIHANDVERAGDRARLLKKLGLDARPVVAGNSIGGQANEAAVRDGVAVVLRDNA